MRASRRLAVCTGVVRLSGALSGNGVGTESLAAPLVKRRAARTMTVPSSPRRGGADVLNYRGGERIDAL